VRVASVSVSEEMSGSGRCVRVWVCVLLVVSGVAGAASMLRWLTQCSMWARALFSGRRPKSVSQRTQILSSAPGGEGMAEGFSLVSCVDIVLEVIAQPGNKTRLESELRPLNLIEVRGNLLRYNVWFPVSTWNDYLAEVVEASHEFLFSL